MTQFTDRVVEGPASAVKRALLWCEAHRRLTGAAALGGALLLIWLVLG